MRAKRQVLVVEDCPDLRATLTEALEPLGVETLEASNGRAAIRQLQETTPKVVCLDVCLPESSGYDVVEHIRADPRLRNVPVLMMSGRRLPNEAAFAEEAGADYFLAKPFTSEAFLGSVERLLLPRSKKDGDK